MFFSAEYNSEEANKKIEVEIESKSESEIFFIILPKSPNRFKLFYFRFA